ncbi:MAG: hypothetical protein H6744_05750 [Deltaproteobacteria bacterium]|nr:hypothetical protein [Deltaproteobacteria bacterium]MCB9786182.1 hypothetical protein [Deltaproteobacteria bacterium]
MRLGIHRLIGVGAVLAIFAGCGSGSGIEAHYSAHETTDATAFPDRASTRFDAVTPGEGNGALALVPSGDFGIGAVSASSASYRMVATLGPSLGSSEASRSPHFAAPADPH